jgi:hypothetical protein
MKSQFKLEQQIAKILATQYFAGWRNPKKCVLTRQAYVNKSLINWLPAARGIIDLIRGSQSKPCRRCKGRKYLINPVTHINEECPDCNKC